MNVNFIFGLHNHQPVGNFDNVFENAYENAYLPFLQVMKKFPDIKLCMHYTGILYDWFENNQPDFIDLLGEMISSGQVEILSGAYYEPILPVIPDEDKVSQICMMNRYIEKRFGVKATGMWLAERVWEPHLVKSIAESGIQYIVMDDSHFICTGISRQKLHSGYFITEEQGCALRVFPNNQQLRYLMPFQPFERSIEYMAEHVDHSHDRLLVMADDGEKFGDWPFTYKTVYEEKWLYKFCESVMSNTNWISSTTFSNYMSKHEPVDTIYLPAASYSEMMQWAMPTDKILLYETLQREIEQRNETQRYESFFKGGFWRNFLSKYTEANFMHKKMLSVSKRVNSLKKNTKKSAMALDKLYQGQCNCSYWHGTFGGLYLPHLRTAVYDTLIEAEKIYESVVHKTKKWIECSVEDIDCDGKDEIIVNTDKMAVYIKPSAGGAIFELDHKEKNYNIVNTLSRRKESYHERLIAGEQQRSSEDDGSIPTINELITKQDGLADHLVYDWCLRLLYQDHFLCDNVALDDIAQNRFYDLGDFAKEHYEYNMYQDKKSVVVYMWRFGRLWKNNMHIPVKIEKNFHFNAGSDGFEVEHRIINLSDEFLEVNFSTACNMSLTSGNDPDRYYEINGSSVNEPMLSGKSFEASVKNISCFDQWKDICIDLSFDAEASMFRFPIETVSNSEGGIEKIFQNFCIMPVWSFQLPSHNIWEHKIYQRITRSK